MSNSPADWKHSLLHAAVTDIGMRRTNNQDSHAVVLAGEFDQWYRRGHLFIVADGMGAHAAGELASKLAVDGIPHLYHKHHDLSPPEALQKAILETNTEVNRRGEANPDFQHMGTTSSVLVLLPQGALVAHIGDSRIYRLRGDALRQLTFDHSLVWEMKASGQLPEGVAASNVVPKNVITRSLGPNPKVKIDFEGPYPVQVGDVFLLCSDGLTGRVEDDELAMLMAHLEPRPAAGAMINLANLRGGPDNITVILVKVVGPHITTAAVQAEPLVLGAENDDKKTVHPALWVAMGVFFLSALVMGIASYAVAALAAGCLGVIAATVGVLQKFGSLKFFGSKEVTLSTGKRLGAGPYTETKIQAAAASPEAFQAWSDRTLHAVGHRARRVDLRPFQQQRDEIKSLLESQQPQRAMQLYADMLKTMIDQVRQEQRAQASDSSVEL